MRFCIAWANNTDAWYTALAADIISAGHTITQVNPTSVGAVTTAYDGAGCNALLIPTYTANLDYSTAVSAGRPCVVCDNVVVASSLWTTAPTYDNSRTDIDFPNSGTYIAGSLNNTNDIAFLSVADYQVKWAVVGSLTTIATNSAFGTPGEPIIGKWDVGGTYGLGASVTTRTVLFLIATSDGAGAARLNATSRACLIRSLVWAADGDPEINTLSPADGSTDIDVNTSLTIEFDKPISIGTGNLTVVETGIGNFEVIAITDTGQVTASGTQLTVTLSSNLNPSTNYHILIDSTAISGFAGIASTTTWNFTTGSSDIRLSSQSKKYKNLFFGLPF